MDIKVQIYSFLVGLFMLGTVIWLVRNGKLREEYSILWFLTALIFMALAVWRDSLNVISKLLGIYYVPSALFLIGMFFLVVILLHFSTVLTKLSNQTKELAQRLALLDEKIKRDQGGMLK
jgi:hypothetical protein